MKDKMYTLLKEIKSKQLIVFVRSAIRIQALVRGHQARKWKKNYISKAC